mmetsp:Transcript_3226/g.7676  ORF Transcript_3226/g.7676 Transcript_3226/m.7676 type:complete len:105 (+) Transcript_3226:1774-2088(+)
MKLYTVVTKLRIHYYTATSEPQQAGFEIFSFESAWDRNRLFNIKNFDQDFESFVMNKQQQWWFLVQYTLCSILGRGTVATVGQSHISELCVPTVRNIDRGATRC